MHEKVEHSKQPTAKKPARPYQLISVKSILLFLVALISLRVLTAREEPEIAEKDSKREFSPKDLYPSAKIEQEVYSAAESNLMFLSPGLAHLYSIDTSEDHDCSTSFVQMYTGEMNSDLTIEAVFEGKEDPDYLQFKSESAKHRDALNQCNPHRKNGLKECEKDNQAIDDTRLAFLEKKSAEAEYGFFSNHVRKLKSLYTAYSKKECDPILFKNKM